MSLLAQTLCLLLAFSYVTPHHHEGAAHPAENANHKSFPDRCKGIEFDAVTVDEHGTPFFFEGDHLWKGFTGPAELSNVSFKELDDLHELDHVDAAFHMHTGEDPDDHEHIFFFLNDKTFSYYNHSLEKGYPKSIADVFPGIPDHLDAAVECPKGECGADSVIFFKGDHVYHFDMKAKTVEEKKDWAQLPNCTSAFRWLSNYYCFHGHEFTKFHPVTGVVTEKIYPKDARGYFMKCNKLDDTSDPTEREKCSHVKVDALAADDRDNLYVFRADYCLHLNNLTKAFPFEGHFKELHGDVDAAFSHKDSFFLIKDELVYAYKEERGHPLVEGYPKSVKDVLGIEGHVDAAFLCGAEDTVYIIQGKGMHQVDLSTSPPVVGEEIPLPFPRVDAAVCGPTGVKVLIGSHFYVYKSPMIMAASKALPESHKISKDLLGCDH